MDDKVLLHVKSEGEVHKTLKKLPENTDGHGEAEGHNGHEHRGQRQGEALVPVEHIHQRKADGGAEKAVDGVQRSVPALDGGVEGLDLAQNLSGEDKQQDDDLQCVRQIDHQLFFKDGGQHEEHQCQHSHENIFVVFVEKLSPKSL